MSKKLCIYHANCPDGFTAAWAVHKALGDDVEFYRGIHGERPPSAFQRDVIIVDFCYRLSPLEVLLKEANSVLILDHHISAMKNLEGYEHPKLTAVFDLERSGAGITWDHFHPHVDRPYLVDFVEDRDLWKFEYPDTREVLAVLDTHEFTFSNWDNFSHALQTNKGFVAASGEVILKRYFKDLDDAINSSLREVTIGGYTVPLVNVSHVMASDAGNKLAKGKPFAASYYDAEDGRRFSLRSSPEGLDVSEIAAIYGGGGHKHASGFTVPRHHELAKV